MGKLVLRNTILRNMIDRVWAPLKKWAVTLEVFHIFTFLSHVFEEKCSVYVLFLATWDLCYKFNAIYYILRFP
jgi:hypothetical protein